MTRNQTFLFLNALLVVTFFYSISFLSYSIALYFFVAVFVFFREKLHRFTDSTDLINTGFVIIPLVVLLISMIWTENQVEGWNQIAKRAPLVSIPFCIWTQSRVTSTNIYVRAINGWVLASSAFTLYGLLTIFFGYKIDYFTELTFVHIRHLLSSEVLFMHPVYIGLASGISCIISLHQIVQKGVKGKRYFSAALIINGLMLLLTSARMPIIATFICCLAIMKFNKKRIIIYAVSAIGILLFSQKLFPGYRFNEITQLIQNFKNVDADNKNTLATRQKIYVCAFKLAASNPILGYGVGDSVDTIQSCHAMKSEEGRLNSHNQYMEFMLAAGAFGLMLLLAYLFKVFKFFLRKNNLLGIALLSYFMLNMITENIFARTWGVFLFSYFVFMSCIIKSKNV